MLLTNDLSAFSIPLLRPDSASSIGENCATAGTELREDFVGDRPNLTLKYLCDVDCILPSDWPLVLFGASGTGKTALGCTLASQVSVRSNRKALYFTADEFRRRLADSFETGCTHQFRELAYSSSVLFIDDLHQLAGYAAAQIELACLLDRLDDMNIPAIFTSGPLFLEADALTHRLASRLASGLCLQVHAPGYAARKILFADTARSMNLVFSDKELEFLANNCSLTFPRIRSFLALFSTWLKSRGNTLTTEPKNRLTDFLASWVTSGGNNTGILDAIIREVCVAYKLKTNDIKSKSRQKSVVLARGVAIFLLRDLLNLSYSKIGTIFGGRDHSTIMHAVNRIKSEIKKDEHFKSTLENIKLRAIEKTLINADLLCE